MPMVRASFLFLLLLAFTVQAAEWERWDGCRLATDEYFDGDSFHVTKNGQDKIFRLYAVDTAETDDEFSKRVRAQQKYFGATKKEILAAGRQAEEFTALLLQSPFTVETKWVDARGNSSQPRYFAKITLSDGSDLGLRLIEAGLARSYGMREGLSSSYLKALDRAQESAKAARLGIWADRPASASTKTKKTAAEKSEPESSPVDEGLETQSVFDRLQKESASGVDY